MPPLQWLREKEGGRAMATIKQIATLAGVSRGTVDRVLNNRGKVNPATEAKIRGIASAVHYTPNRLGKTLAIKKKRLRFGYILFGGPGGNPFFEDVMQGIRHKTAELDEYGATVEVRHCPLDDPEAQVRLLEELAGLGVHGIALTPIHHPLVAGAIKALTGRGIPVVTVNSDLPDCGRLAYVGSHSQKSGETAAGLMALLTGGRARVGIVTGSALVQGHAGRVQGFTRRAKEAYTGLAMVETLENHDDDLLSFEAVKGLMADHPEVDALFLAAAGVQGACRALQDLGLAGRLKVVSFDTVPTTRRMVEEGVIAATLGQQPEVQGAQPLDILLDYLGMGIPPASVLNYTAIEIKIRENL